MKLMNTVAAALVGAALLSGPALAADPAAVRGMMEKSGVVTQYQDLGGQLRAALLRSPPPMLPPDLAAQMATIVGNTMDGRKLLDQFEAVLEPSLTTDDIAAMNGFFESDLGARIVKAEIAGGALSAQEDVAANAQALIAEAGKQPDRVAVFERIDRILDGSELSARSSQSLLRALSMAMAEAGPTPPDPAKVAEADRQIDAMHDTFVRQAHDMMIANAQATYRAIPTADMTRYADFLETPPSRITYAAFADVMKDFYAATGKRIGEELAAAVRQRKT